jgi:hypothetical protein
MKRAIILLAATAFFGCQTSTVTNSKFTTASVDHAIRTGALGRDVARRAKCDKLYVREITEAQIPYQLFTFSDCTGVGYTVIVDGGRLVHICSGFGGGFAKDLQLSQRDGKAVLNYKFDIGSGSQIEMSGSYAIGTRKSVTTFERLNP